jgi:hypothetical protein
LCFRSRQWQRSPLSKQSTRRGSPTEDRLRTLLLGILTPEEEQIDLRTRELHFDIPRLASRLTRERVRLDISVRPARPMLKSWSPSGR